MLSWHCEIVPRTQIASPKVRAGGAVAQLNWRQFAAARQKLQFLSLVGARRAVRWRLNAKEKSGAEAMDSNGNGDVVRGCSARESRVHDDEGGRMSSGGPHAGDYCRREQWGQSLDEGGGALPPALSRQPQ